MATVTERYAVRTLFNGTNQNISPSSTIQAGTSAILLYQSGASVVISSVSDSKGNTWVVDKTATLPTGSSVARGTISASILTSDTITITYSGVANANRNIFIQEITPIRPSPLDVAVAANGGPGTQPSAGSSGVLAQADEILFTLVYNGQASPITFTPGAGWTATTSPGLPSAAQNNCAVQYRITAATTAVTGNGTFSRTDETWGTIMVSYKIAGNAPVNTVAPVASGSPQEGQNLAVTNGTWTDDGSPTYTYQWQRDNSGGGAYGNIGGATATPYTLVAADVGCNVRCVVTDTDSNGATSANSNSLGLVIGIPINSVAPAITPTTVVPGHILTCSTGTWSDMGAGTYAYQWYSNGAAITGAISAAYTTTAGDVGNLLYCKVVATNAAGSSSAVQSSNSVTPAYVYGGGGWHGSFGSSGFRSGFQD